MKKEAKTFTIKADAITGAGELVGWALAPTVTVFIGRDRVAKARACLFRPDLLRAGYGHGHYGFRARLRQPPAGRRALLTLSAGGTSVTVRLPVPPPVGARPCTVEALLSPPAGWTVEDFLARPGCLAWAEQLATLGVARFVDAAFRFALHRWPSAVEAAVHGRALAHGTISAESLAVRLLTSRERADLPPALMSPFDPDFLFDARLLSGNPGADAG